MTLRTPNALCLAIAIPLCLASSGCSLVYTTGPDVEPRHMTAKTRVECTSSAAPAVVDTVFTATHTGGAIAGAVLPDEAFGGSKPLRVAAVVTDVTLALLHAASAYYGYTTSDACREAEARAKELAVERESAITVPPGTARPNGVAGFRIGISEAAAERRCTAAGRTFRSGDGFHICEGTASGPAQTDSIQLKLDDRGLWSIEMVIPAGAQWPDTFTKLRKDMVKLYGDPVRIDVDVPDECIREAKAAACAERGEMKVSTEWEWPNGDRLVLQVPPLPGPLTIRVLYTRPQRTPPKEPGGEPTDKLAEESEPSAEPPAQVEPAAP